ncbi:MAG: hypothetical protein NT125_00630 [Candidatus Bipolaricaulota bacterium]|nr:hypothetical protein [Candidatus Bipolaricaulota bacterium]
MRIINPRAIGAAAGLLAGLLLILVTWKVMLILVGFALAGYLVGVYLESREDVNGRLREFFRRLFRR